MTIKMGMRHMARNIKFVASIAGVTALCVASSAMAQSAGISTHTELTKEVQQIAGRDVITYAATVLDANGAPATGSVALMEGNRALASAAIDSTGQASIRYDGLSAADHNLRAVYAGDETHQPSKSESIAVHPEAAASPDFALAINVPGGTNATTMTIATPGDSGSLVATITPTTGFTGFISLSLSGPPANTGAPGGTSLPVGVSYTFTPANLQIGAPTTANPTAAATAQMELVTTAYNGTNGRNEEPNLGPGSRSSGAPVFLAFLLPGAVALVYLGRKRRLFSRAFVIVMVGGLTMASLTGCAARYKYLNHGPAPQATQPGTYTLTVTAQTSNGVTASSQSQTMTLIVK